MFSATQIYANNLAELNDHCLLQSLIDPGGDCNFSFKSVFLLTGYKQKVGTLKISAQPALQALQDMSHFKSRYLAYLLNQRSQEGFTLIELLVTIVIIALLSALALPSMLQQSLKARQSTAQSHLGAVNRSQQVYRLKSKVFASSMAELGVQIPLSTSDYNYSFGTANTSLAELKATPNDTLLSAYTGCTVTTTTNGNLATTAASIKKQPASGGSAATPPNC